MKDDEFHVKNVFWTDARSKDAHEAFRDVVSFDTTLTNKYEMFFPTFFGANSHSQSIVLVCGLLSTKKYLIVCLPFRMLGGCLSVKPPSGWMQVKDKQFGRITREKRTTTTQQSKDEHKNQEKELQLSLGGRGIF